MLSIPELTESLRERAAAAGGRVELRFGFAGESASLETIGKELGLTRERVRQLESEALMRLQLELGDELASAA